MRSACVQCQCEMRCSKTGATIVVMSGGEPYQLWQADIFQCPGCRFEAVTGWAGRPFAYRHDMSFNAILEHLRLGDKEERIEYVYEKVTPQKSILQKRFDELIELNSVFYGGKLAEKKDDQD